MDSSKREGFLQDIAFDYYNNKMATCNTSSQIHIYTKDTNENKWTHKTWWDAGDVVFRLQFSHPEFGNLLASCGLNKLVLIWKEEKDTSESQWIQRAKIQDFTESVEDISFCPYRHGLKLATVTLNGKLKIFEPSDYIHYSNWNCLVTEYVCVAGCSSVCWNPTSSDPQSLIVGCMSNKDSDEWKLGKEKLIRLYVFNESNIKNCTSFYFENGHCDDVTDIEWANRSGRDFHLIASCSLDKKLIVWTLVLNADNKGKKTEEVNIKYCKCFEYLHSKPLWRVSWNYMATLLSVIDEDGEVLVFKKVARDKFEKMNISDNVEYENKH